MSKLIREKGADSRGVRSFALEELLGDRFTISCDAKGCLVIPAGPATVGNPGSLGGTGTPEADGAKSREELDRVAYEKGFDRGHREGLALARKEMKTNIEELGNLLQDLSTYKARIYAETEAQLLELTLALAEVVIRHEVHCRAEIVRETLQTALAMAAENGRLKVSLHPEDLENIKQFIPQLEQRLGSATRLECEGDLAISRGGCLVETDSGIIDARLEGQLEVLRQQLRETSKPRRQETTAENELKD